METTTFRFPEMAAWYESHRDNPELFINDREMVAYFIEPAQKYERSRKEPNAHITSFVKQRIGTEHVRRLRFLPEDSLAFPHGVYVFPAPPKNMFFVYPSYRASRDPDTGAAKQILVADHFSFPYQRGLALTNVHKTDYAPLASNYRLGCY